MAEILPGRHGNLLATLGAMFYQTIKFFVIPALGVNGKQETTQHDHPLPQGRPSRPENL